MYNLITTEGQKRNFQFDSVQILADVTDIDLTVVATTDLYTVPTGKNVLITGVQVWVIAANGAAAVATVSVGTQGATYQDIIPATAMASLSTNQSDILPLDGTSIRRATATETIKFNVSIGATATALTGRVILLGIVVE